METQNCLVCGEKLQSQDEHIFIHERVTHHTATPLKNIVESTLNKVVSTTDIMCKQCLNLFDEKDRLQKMATDMDSHIMTKVKDVSREVLAQSAPAISITVGESLTSCNIKEELERQYKNINIEESKDLSCGVLKLQDVADSSQTKVKKKRGRPRKVNKVRAEENSEPPPPLMVHERQKRKRSEKFNAFLEVLKGEKDFYIMDEDKEEPRVTKRRGGRKKQSRDPDITYVGSCKDEDNVNKMCIIQLTDIKQEPQLQRAVKETAKLNLSEVVEEILGLDSNAEENLMKDIGRMDHSEDDLIKVIEFMDTNNVGRTEDDIDLKEFSLNEVDEIDIKGESINWHVKSTEANNKIRAEVMENDGKFKRDNKAFNSTHSPQSCLTNKVIDEVIPSKPSIEVADLEGLVSVMPNLEVTITHKDDNTLLAVVSNHDDDDGDSCIVKEGYLSSPSTELREARLGENGKEISEKFRCKLCHQTFSSKELARAHAQKYHKENLPTTTNDKLFGCKDCERTFQTAKGRDKHHVQMHLRYTPVQCDECNVPFNSFRPLERHLRTVHDMDPSLHCKNCEEEFVLESSLRVHVELSHPTPSRKMPKYTTTIDNSHKASSFSKTKKVRLVDKIKTNRLFQCPICQEKIFGIRAVKSHHKKVHDNQEYTCRFCKYKSLCLSTYDRHMVKVHKASTVELYHCLKCRKGFQDPKSLEDHHISFHRAEQTYRCRYCGEAFACMSMLRFHIKSHVAFSCKVCYLGFMKEEALEEHVKTVHNSDCTGDVSKSLSEDGRMDNSKENLEPEVQEESGGDKQTDNSGGASSKVLEIACDGTVEIKETKMENATTATPNDEAVTLHLQQSREGGLEEMDVLNPLRGHKVKDLPKKMNCPVCDKVLTTKFLRTHMLSHKGELPHKCKICGKGYAQGTLLRKHMKNRHYEEFLKLGNKNPKKHKVSCEFCENIYNDIYALEDHLWTHMSVKPLECSDCKIRFGMESNLREHYKNHYFKEPQLCPVCKREFKSIGFYNEHVERCQNRWKCEQCGLECYTQRYYKKHQRAEHGGDDVHRYQCNLCEKSFMERHRYEDHLITHSSEKNFICSICQKQFKRQRPLNDHMNRCHMGIQFTRQICRKPLPCKRDLDIHKKSNSKSCKQYLCTDCGNFYDSKEALTNHFDTCELNKLSCNINGIFNKQSNLKIQIEPQNKGSGNLCPIDGCNKTFRTEGTLRNHVARHHSEHIYSCTVCNRRFDSEADQIRHLATHTSEAKFSCLVCETTFKTEASLDRHVLIHTQEKPYECGVCQEYSTFSHTQIVRHIQEDHGQMDYHAHIVVKRWRCTSCDKMFMVQTSLLRHLEEHAVQGIRAQGFAVKTTSSAAVDVTTILNSCSATSASAFIDQVATLSWDDITALLRLHVVTDEAGEGETLTAADEWQCSGCLLVTQAEEVLRDHLQATPLCQEAVILQMADGFQNTVELEGSSINEQTLDAEGGVSEVMPQLSNETEEWQYLIVQEGETISKLSKEIDIKQELKKEVEIEEEEECEGESVPILVNMDESIQQLLQQPGHGNIQIVVEDNTPLKDLLEGNHNQAEQGEASATSSSVVQDNLTESASILNGSEVLLQTEDGQLLLQQTVNGVTQYQLVEGVPATSEEEESSLTLIQSATPPPLSASKFIEELQSQCL